LVRPQLEQFEIHRMVPATTLGYDVSFTNASLFMLITLVGVWAFLTLGMRRATLVPGRWQSAIEMIHEFVAGMVDENIGHNGRRYVPFIFALFIFILFANILGLLPFAFAVTSHIWVTFAFAAFIFLLCLAIGFARHGLHFFELFVPPQTPIVLLPLIVLIELIASACSPT
jgi:F-type H+-transporting ATPase subunit a